MLTYADALWSNVSEDDKGDIFDYFLPPSPYRPPDAIRDQLLSASTVVVVVVVPGASNALRDPTQK